MGTLLPHSTPMWSHEGCSASSSPACSPGTVSASPVLGSRGACISLGQGEEVECETLAAPKPTSLLVSFPDWQTGSTHVLALVHTKGCPESF